MTSETAALAVRRGHIFRWLGDGIARLRAPIRAKLLIAFLGIAVLMIAVALTGVSELRKANLRTAELITLNIKIAGLNNLRRRTLESMLAGTAILVDNYSSPQRLAGNLTEMMSIVSGNAASVDRPSRFGDIDQAIEMKLKVQEFQTLGNEIAALWYEGDVKAARTLFDNQLRRGLRAFDREVLKLTFDARLKMREQAEFNQVAYQRSRQLVLGASGLAVVLALALGFFISTSIIRPVTSIRQTLREVAQGDFTARASVENRDELGDLAQSTNNMTGQLGTLYEELETANRHKSQFLANMSHEFRTPMNSILGYTELIQDGIYGDVPEKIADPLQRVEANGKALLSLINDVLDVSKIEAGHLDLQLEPYALDDVIAAAVATVTPMAADKSLTLNIDVDDSLPQGTGDATRIGQVVLNVLGNAVKFTEQGSVSMHASVEGGQFCVEIADTGPGIAAEDQAGIFDEFRQADASTTRATGGTGLGLSISKKLTEMHGGRIEVQSTPGEGSRFIIRLPVQGREVSA